MADSTPVERALTMLKENMFMTLATAENGLPWCAPVAFVPGPGPALHFYSAAESAHSRHLQTNPGVSMAVFDSRARGEEVDGMQLEAQCHVVDPPELNSLVEHYFHRLFPDEALRSWWYRPPSAFTGSGLWRFYRLDIEAAFVIDLDNFAETKIDRRVRVDLPHLLNGIEALGA